MAEVQIMQELKEIKKDIKFIKKHMIDIDSILTSEEEKNLEESLKEFKEGRTTSLEDFEKEIKNARD